MSGFTALYTGMGFPTSTDSWGHSGKAKEFPFNIPLSFICRNKFRHHQIDESWNRFTRRPDLVVIGVMLGSGGLSDATGCSSATVARGMCETGFAGTCCSGASDNMCLVGPFAVTATVCLFPA